MQSPNQAQEDIKTTIVGCPSCQQRLRVPSGRHLRVTCPKCQIVFEVSAGVSDALQNIAPVLIEDERPSPTESLRRAKALANPDTVANIRDLLAAQYFVELNKTDPDTAKEFAKNADLAIKNKMPLEVDAGFFEQRAVKQPPPAGSTLYERPDVAATQPMGNSRWQRLVSLPSFFFVLLLLIVALINRHVSYLTLAVIAYALGTCILPSVAFFLWLLPRDNMRGLRIHFVFWTAIMWVVIVLSQAQRLSERQSVATIADPLEGAIRIEPPNAPLDLAQFAPKDAPVDLHAYGFVRQDNAPNAIEHQENASGQYYVSRGYIYGPKLSGQFYISNGYIYGPKNSGQYYISNGYIYGPRKGGQFYISNDYIYGPAEELPWLEE
jgi:hypothetical protein